MEARSANGLEVDEALSQISASYCRECREQGVGGQGRRGLFAQADWSVTTVALIVIVL